MNHLIRRSWVEVNLSQIQNNYKIYKKNIPSKSSVMAVVKADAYGHGDVEIAKALSNLGVNHWAVSNIEEALRIRESGIKGEILILGYTPIDSLSFLNKYDITQAILSEEYADELLKCNLDFKCQFAIDTGMNRIGLDADNPEKCIKTIRYYADKLNINGVFTHLCVADSNSDFCMQFTQEQIDKFETVVNGIQDLELENIHCLNSAGGLWKATKYNSIIRLGIILYGLKPDYNNVLPLGIKPAITWKSVITMIKTIRAGESVGYGCTFTAKKNIRVATISTGYADGYSRFLSNKGHVEINGKYAPIVGRVCMDQFMIDVSDISDIKIGTEVQLLNSNYNADDMAQDIGTIGYEVICNISKRVPRVYLE